MARPLLVKVLASQSTEGGEWMEMYSQGEGTWYLNKSSGKATFSVPQDVRIHSFSAEYPSFEPAREGNEPPAAHRICPSTWHRSNHHRLKSWYGKR